MLALLAEMSVDVALVDVSMPGMGGLEAFELVRRDFPQVRVIMLSMHDDPAHVPRAVELGAYDYLLKNTSRDELIRTLETVAAGDVYLRGEVVTPLVTESHDSASTFRLSPREREVLQLVAHGHENKQIATELGISDATVRTYLCGILERFGASSRAEAVAVGLREGLID